MSAQRKPRERHYATKAKVKTFVEVAKDMGIKVGGFEVTPDGTIRILSEQAAHAAKAVEDDFEQWFSKGN